MLSANTDPDLRQWLRWASEEGKTPMLVRNVAEAVLMACSPDYELLRPVLVELKRRYPEAGARNQTVLGRRRRYRASSILTDKITY
jgi:hypothetical protein